MNYLAHLVLGGCSQRPLDDAGVSASPKHLPVNPVNPVGFVDPIGLESFDQDNHIMQDAEHRDFLKNQRRRQEDDHGAYGKPGKHTPNAVVFSHIFARGNLFQSHRDETEDER